MKKAWAILVWAFWFWGVNPSCSQPTTSPGYSGGVSMTPQKWKKILAEFEESVFSLSGWLQNAQLQGKKLQTAITTLEDKIAQLRLQTQNNPGVLDEIKLKGLLNDLKDYLQKNSDLQHQMDEKSKEFQQKALSLISLYNDRINYDLADPILASNSNRLPYKFNDIAQTIQKRNRVQALMRQFEKKTKGEEPLPPAPLGNLQTGDRESLQLTFDLLQDRKKDIESKLDKWSIEQDEIRNELKLQGKMEDFLQDIERLNEDSSFPHGSLKRDDLEDMAGNKEKKRLAARLKELQEKIGNSKANLEQINQLLEKIKEKLKGSSTGGKS